jgi:hypothetical protein
LAKVIGVSHGLIAQVWRRTGLQPHRLERYMLSNDPDFEQKAADVLGLYLSRRNTRWSSPSMRRPRFRLSIASTRCCRSRPAEPNAMASSTTDTAHQELQPRPETDPPTYSNPAHRITTDSSNTVH